jgi:hypothetical protein
MWVLLKKARFGCSDTAAGESIMPTEVPEGLTDELNSWGVRCFAEKYRNIPPRFSAPLRYVSTALGKHLYGKRATNDRVLVGPGRDCPSLLFPRLHVHDRNESRACAGEGPSGARQCADEHHSG